MAKKTANTLTKMGISDILNGMECDTYVKKYKVTVATFYNHVKRIKKQKLQIDRNVELFKTTMDLSIASANQIITFIGDNKDAFVSTEVREYFTVNKEGGKVLYEVVKITKDNRDQVAKSIAQVLTRFIGTQTKGRGNIADNATSLLMESMRSMIGSTTIEEVNDTQITHHEVGSDDPEFFNS